VEVVFSDDVRFFDFRTIVVRDVLAALEADCSSRLQPSLRILVLLTVMKLLFVELLFVVVLLLLLLFPAASSALSASSVRLRKELPSAAALVEPSPLLLVALPILFLRCNVLYIQCHKT